jgi:segregation and condensation protein A
MYFSKSSNIVYLYFIITITIIIERKKRGRYLKKPYEYKVKLDLFEGPLDLLLYLVNKAEVEIKDISIAEITGQYLEYLEMIHHLNLNVASEYLSMAATLLRLKSKDIFPSPENEEIEEEEEIINRQQLIDKLLEYKKFKEAAGSLRTYETEQYGSYPRGKNEEIEIKSDSDEVLLGNINVFDLFTAFKAVLERKTQEKSDTYKFVKWEDVKLDDRIEYIICRMDEDREVLFDDLFKEDNRKIVLVVTFMAILELVKMKQITFRQECQFGSLFVKKYQLKSKKD